jgi:nucleolar protein 56
MATHALLETASGYAIFQVNFKEDIGSSSKQVQASINDFAKFSKMVSLLSFSPFKNAAHALENSNDISEGALKFMLRFHPREIDGYGIVL